MMDMGPKQQERIRKARSALGALLDITRLWRIYGHELHKRGILKHLLDPEYDPLKHSAFTGIGGPKGDSLSDWIKQEVGLRVTDKDILGLMEMHKNITKWASPISAPLEPGGALSDADALRHLSSLPGPGTPPDLGRPQCLKTPRGSGGTGCGYGICAIASWGTWRARSRNVSNRPTEGLRDFL